MKSRSFQSWVPAAALLLTSLAQAHWTTQTFDLRGGWNAAYLNVDPSHATISQLLASDPGPSIEEIWMWQVPSSLGQFVSSPQQPVSGTSQWRTWRRTDVAGSSLQGLVPNAAYLVRVRSDLSNFTWQVKGKAVAPSHRWTGSGLNFVGFPTLPTTPPTFEDFLAQSPAEFQQTAEIFRYPGGNLGVGNPARVFALRTTRVRRGEAFWMRSAEHYNSYFGPFDLTVSGPGAVDLGDASSVFSMRLRNLAPVPLVVTLNLVASEAPPAGQPAVLGAPPLLVRGERNTTTRGRNTRMWRPTSPRPARFHPASIPPFTKESITFRTCRRTLRSVFIWIRTGVRRDSSCSMESSRTRPWGWTTSS